MASQTIFFSTAKVEACTVLPEEITRNDLTEEDRDISGS